jgi:hypothetical protein
MPWSPDVINARALQEADAGTPLEVLPPVLFNTFKHHAGALRQRVRAVAAGGDDALRQAASHVAILGTKLMDVYTGALSPRDLSQRIIARLEAEGRLEPEAYRAWILGSEEYAVVEMPEDGSRWVLRLGEAERYVHLHPGRWSPATARVRANVLKTAFLVHAHALIHREDPMDRAVIDQVRKTYLGLSPLGADPDGELGLGSVIAMLR